MIKKITSKINQELFKLSEYNKKFRSELKIFWIMGLSLFTSFFLFIFLVFFEFFGKLPSIEELKNPNVSQASEVYSSDGQVIGQYYFLNRASVEYEDISKNVINALITTEDERYFSHSGIDIIGLFRVAIKTIFLSQSESGGGSTITQQLAKMFFPREYNLSKLELVIKKLKEWVIAIKLEINFTKKEIITFYLNQFDFIYNAVGIKSASYTYFNKPPKSLNILESSILVGMAKNPSLYNPYSRPENAKKRRNVVLKRLYANNKISKLLYDSLKKTPITLSFNILNHNEGTSQYFREHLKKFLKKWALSTKKNNGESYNIYTDGLKIYTTIDSKIQTHAENAVKKHMRNLQKQFFSHWKNEENAPFDDTSKVLINSIIKNAIKNTELYKKLKSEKRSDTYIDNLFNKKIKTKVFSWEGEKDTLMSPLEEILYKKHFLNTGVVSIEPVTGKVKSWVGGINFKHFKYDHVNQGARQVGSVFKPFVYCLAIQEGWSACKTIPNVPITIRYGNEVWTPKNSSRALKGKMVSLKKGLAHSINTITASIIKEFGPMAVVNMAKRLGISSYIPAVPAIALGTPDIKVLEIAAAYNVFPSQGEYIKPIFIEKIVDKYGVVLFKQPKEKKEVLSKKTAYNMLNLLEGVVRGGSGSRLRYLYNIEGQVAGKTGTTQNHSDGWFVGILPKLTTAVWVGGEDRITRFRNISQGQGAAMALPIWAYMNKSIMEDSTINISSKDIFKKPKGVEPISECIENKYDNNENRYLFDDIIDF